jgi:hypothetical protein
MPSIMLQRASRLRGTSVTRKSEELLGEQLKALVGAAIVCTLFNLNGGGWPYVLSAGVLKHSIEQQLAGRENSLEFVALVPALKRRVADSADIDEPLALTANMSDALALQGWTVRAVPYLSEFEKQVDPRFAPDHRYYYTMGMKIHAFGLEFRRILYLDVDSVFAAGQVLGETGCFAELLRIDMADCLAAAPYDAQKNLLLLGETEWRRQAELRGTAHGDHIPPAYTQFNGRKTNGAQVSDKYQMMLTGAMTVQPSPGLMSDMRRVLSGAKNFMYSDGDAITDAITKVGIEREKCAWMGIDVLYAAFRGATQNSPYGIQFGGTPPWRAAADWEPVRVWRSMLRHLQHNAPPELAAIYSAHKWFAPE